MTSYRRHACSPLALCLGFLVALLCSTSCLCDQPPTTTLPFSIWQAFVPTSVLYSNRTGLLYQLGSDSWEDPTPAYLTIANLTTRRIQHRQHYIEAHSELNLYYRQHLIWDGYNDTAPTLLILLHSFTTDLSYVLRADAYTGDELSFVAMPYSLWLAGLDVTGAVLYTFLAGGSEFVAFDPINGKRIQAFNASGSGSHIYAGAIHPLTGDVYLHDTDLDGGTTNRIVAITPSLNTVVSSFDLPPLDPAEDELTDTRLAIDSSGRYFYAFLSILHPTNVHDYYVHQLDVSVANVSSEVRVWRINELTDEVMVEGQVSAGPAASDWFVVDTFEREAYWQQSVDVNTTVLIGLPILPFNFHVLVDDDTHDVFVSTGDLRSITVLEVNEQGDLVQQFEAGFVDCGDAGFYAPIAAIDYHAGADHAQLLVPQCNHTIQVFDRWTARRVGEYATNQTVNLVIIASDRTHHRLYMTTDASNTIVEIDLTTWQVTRQFITGNDTATVGEHIRSLVVDERRGLLYAGEYIQGSLYVFSLDQPSAPLARLNYTAPSGLPWSFTSLALSANGTQLFASLNTDDGETTVAVIDSTTGALVQQLVYPSAGGGEYFSFIGGLAVDTARDVLYLSVGKEDGVFHTSNFSSYLVAPSSFDGRLTKDPSTVVSVE